MQELKSLIKIKKPVRGIHSEAHALAKEISEYCHEPKKFAMYLGIIKRMGLSRAYQVFAELKRSPDVKTPGKLFFWKARFKKQKSRTVAGLGKSDVQPIKNKIKKAKQKKTRNKTKDWGKKKITLYSK